MTKKSNKPKAKPIKTGGGDGKPPKRPKRA